MNTFCALPTYPLLQKSAHLVPFAATGLKITIPFSSVSEEPLDLVCVRKVHPFIAETPTDQILY
jgi:hypothetical protein